MKLRILFLFLLFFTKLSSDGILAQDLSLKITSKNKTEATFLNNINHIKKHKNTTTLHSEIKNIHRNLKLNGYFVSTIDSLIKKKQTYQAFFSLNSKIDSAIIKISPNLKYLFRKQKSDSLLIPINEVEVTLNNISKRLDIEGQSFSKAQLRNIHIKNKILYSDLQIHQSKKRYLNKVIIKGYKNFPKSYLKNYFNITPNSVFNQKKIKEISNSSKGLDFLDEIKPPEVLFTKDSTLLFMYLKKKQNSSFDGIVNFASKEDGSVLFNGNINLKLNNTLNKGEKFALFWNSIGKERQEFRLSTSIPYILNSKISPAVAFSIYRQDSSFINTSFNTQLFYHLNRKTKVSLNYSSESSKKLEELNLNNIETFKNFFLGFTLQYKIPKGDNFLNDIFYFEIKPTFGERKNDINTSSQFKIELTSSFLWDIGKRSSIFIKNSSGYLNSDNYLTNELFRIGGANSIRGFDEQSIFSNNYSFFNIEYRYLTSLESYFYTITDLGKNNSKNLLGLGLGYSFKQKNNLIKFAITAGSSSNNDLKFRNSKFNMIWVNFF